MFIICLAFIAWLLPVRLWAATLYLSPSTGSHEINNNFTVTIGVNTASVAINAAQATISFPTNRLEVRGISKSGTFTLWPVEPTYSNSSGTIRFGGGVPTPGYNGSHGSILTITFRGKSEGTASVTIGSATVLANDGLGTNVLTSSGSGSYTITAPIPEKPLPHAPTITSSTQPDQNVWYAVNDSSFQWSDETGVTGYSYSFDDNESRLPDTVQDTTGNSASFTGTADGVWYFHVRAKNDNGWGPTSTFRVRIDKTAPEPFNINLLDGQTTTVRQPRLSFKANDATSGIHHYSMSINNGVSIDLEVGTTEPYALAELPNGDYIVQIIAYDFAGNSTTAQVTFAVNSESPLNTNTTTNTNIPSNSNTGTNTNEETGEISLPDFIPEVIKNIILPAPVKKVISSINRTIKRAQQNQQVTQIIDDVISPTMTVTAVVTAAGVAATTTGIELFNMVYLFFRFGYFWLVPVSASKRRRPWGVVFDSTTGKPVRRAVVRLFSKEYNKLRETQITDAEGRYGFLLDPGEYYVTVTCPGFQFPSKILQTAVVSLYENIYRGNIFSVKDKKESALSYNIPIDPEFGEIKKRRLFWLRLLNIFGLVLEKLNTPLLVGGTVISWLALIIQPLALNYGILAVYAILLVFKLIFSKRFQKSWGVVTDSTTGSPIQYVVVRIYNMNSGTIIGMRVTNRLGQFTTLVSPGTYYVIGVKYGYYTFQSKPVEVTKRHAMLKMRIQLVPQLQKNSIARDGIINLESMGSSLGGTESVSQVVTPPSSMGASGGPAQIPAKAPGQQITSKKAK